MANPPGDTLRFSEASRALLESYLPPEDLSQGELPFTTLTFATSLDSSLALRPGALTILSGAHSKSMTHYLRSRHDAILIGVGTAVADDPGLNCRLEGMGGYGGDGLVGQPRPIIIDPAARWKFTENSKLFKLIENRRGKAPYIVTSNRQPPAEQTAMLERCGGKYVLVERSPSQVAKAILEWCDILSALAAEGIKSVMIEGGGAVINSMLKPGNTPLINSVIVTIAPTWLGRGGVVVSPQERFDADGKPVAAVRLADVKWCPLGEDVVLCGRIGP